MLKIGLEKEYFVVGEKGPELVPFALPADDCGWLIEARGEPSFSLIQAIFSLKAEEYRIKKILEEQSKDSIKMEDAPFMKIPKQLRIAAGRTYAKGLVSYQNFYGYDDHNTNLGESTAGVHISFTSPKTEFKTISLQDGTKVSRQVEYNANFDWPYIFMELDSAFKDEIKEAKRRPGFYEVKSDGRVEYRSLPANISLDKIIDVLNPIIKNF